MGARPSDYSMMLPPHSYIHVDDFNSPRDLAIYLHRLDADDKLYNEYFRWKTEWTLADYRFNYTSCLCLLCGMLHAADVQNYVHWYPDYRRYWIGVNGSECSTNWQSWLTWH